MKPSKHLSLFGVSDTGQWLRRPGWPCKLQQAAADIVKMNRKKLKSLSLTILLGLLVDVCGDQSVMFCTKSPSSSPAEFFKIFLFFYLNQMQLRTVKNKTNNKNEKHCVWRCHSVCSTKTKCLNVVWWNIFFSLFFSHPSKISCNKLSS